MCDCFLAFCEAEYEGGPIVVDNPEGPERWTVTLDAYRSGFDNHVRDKENNLTNLFADAAEELARLFPKMHRLFTRCPDSPDITEQWQQMLGEVPKGKATVGAIQRTFDAMEELKRLRFRSLTNLVTNTEMEKMRSQLGKDGGRRWIIFPLRDPTKDQSKRSGLMPVMTAHAIKEALEFCGDKRLGKSTFKQRMGLSNTVQVEGVVSKGYYFQVEEMDKLKTFMRDLSLETHERAALQLVSLGNVCDEGTLQRFIDREPRAVADIIFNSRDIVLSDPALLELEELKPGVLQEISQSRRGDQWHEERRRQLLVQNLNLIDNAIKDNDGSRLQQMLVIGAALSVGQTTAGGFTLLHRAAESGAGQCLAMLQDSAALKKSGPGCVSEADGTKLFNLAEMPKTSKRSLIIAAATGGMSELFDKMYNLDKTALAHECILTVDLAASALLVAAAKGHFGFIDTILNNKEYADVHPRRPKDQAGTVSGNARGARRPLRLNSDVLDDNFMTLMQVLILKTSTVMRKSITTEMPKGPEKSKWVRDAGTKLFEFLEDFGTKFEKEYKQERGTLKNFITTTYVDGPGVLQLAAQAGYGSVCRWLLDQGAKYTKDVVKLALVGEDSHRFDSDQDNKSTPEDEEQKIATTVLMMKFAGLKDQIKLVKMEEDSLHVVNLLIMIVSFDLPEDVFKEVVELLVIADRSEMEDVERIPEGVALEARTSVDQREFWVNRFAKAQSLADKCGKDVRRRFDEARVMGQVSSSGGESYGPVEDYYGDAGGRSDKKKVTSMGLFNSLARDCGSMSEELGGGGGSSQRAGARNVQTTLSLDFRMGTIPEPTEIVNKACGPAPIINPEEEICTKLLGSTALNVTLMATENKSPFTCPEQWAITIDVDLSVPTKFAADKNARVALFKFGHAWDKGIQASNAVELDEVYLVPCRKQGGKRLTVTSGLALKVLESKGQTNSAWSLLDTMLKNPVEAERTPGSQFARLNITCNVLTKVFVIYCDGFLVERVGLKPGARPTKYQATVLDEAFSRLQLYSGITVHLSANPTYMESPLKIRYLEVVPVYMTLRMVRQMLLKNWDIQDLATDGARNSMYKFRKLISQYSSNKMRFYWNSSSKAANHSVGFPMTLAQPIWVYEGFIHHLLGAHKHWTNTSSDDFIENKAVYKPDDIYTPADQNLTALALDFVVMVLKGIGNLKVNLDLMSASMQRGSPTSKLVWNLCKNLSLDYINQMSDPFKKLKDNNWTKTIMKMQWIKDDDNYPEYGFLPRQIQNKLNSLEPGEFLLVPYAGPEPMMFVLHLVKGNEELVYVAVINCSPANGLVEHATKAFPSLNSAKLKFKKCMRLGPIAKEEISCRVWWETLFMEMSLALKPRRFGTGGGIELLYKRMIPLFIDLGEEDVSEPDPTRWQSPMAKEAPSFFHCLKASMLYILRALGASLLEEKIFTTLFRAELLRLAEGDKQIHTECKKVLPLDIAAEDSRRDGLLNTGVLRLTASCLKLTRDMNKSLEASKEGRDAQLATELRGVIVECLEEMNKNVASTKVSDVSRPMPPLMQDAALNEHELADATLRKNGATSAASSGVRSVAFKDMEVHPFFDAFVRQRAPQGITSKVVDESAGRKKTQVEMDSALTFMQVHSQCPHAGGVERVIDALALLTSVEKLCVKIDSSPMIVAMEGEKKQVSHVVFVKLALLVDLFTSKLPIPDSRKTLPWGAKEMTQGDQTQILQVLQRLTKHFVAAALTVSRDYAVGSKVKAQFRDGRWLGATITAATDEGTFEVDWESGENTDRIKKVKELKLLEAAPGMWSLRAIVTAAIATIADCVVRNQCGTAQMPAVTRAWNKVAGKSSVFMYGLCIDVFEELTSRQAVSMLDLVKSRSRIIAYHREVGSLSPDADVFGFEHNNFKLPYGKPMKSLLGQISGRLLFPQDEQTLSTIATGKNERFEQICPEFGCFRDIAFFSKLFLTPTSYIENRVKSAIVNSSMVQPDWAVNQGFFTVSTALSALLGDKPVEANVMWWDMAEPNFYHKFEETEADASPPKALTEDDVLHIEKLHDFNGSVTQEDAELLFQFLTVPYLRLPLTLKMFASAERVTAVSDDQVQSLLQQVIFQPGRFVRPQMPGQVDDADKPVYRRQSPVRKRDNVARMGNMVMCRGKRNDVMEDRLRRGPLEGSIQMPRPVEDIGTESSLLLNELQCGPEGFLDSMLSVLRFSFASASRSPFSATTQLVLFAIRLGCAVDNFAREALEKVLPRHREALDEAIAKLNALLRRSTGAKDERKPALELMNDWLARLDEEWTELTAPKSATADAEGGGKVKSAGATQQSEIREMQCLVHAHRVLLLNNIDEEEVWPKMMASIARLISSYSWTTARMGVSELEFFMIVHRKRPRILRWLHSKEKASLANDAFRQFYDVATEASHTATWWCVVEEEQKQQKQQSAAEGPEGDLSARFACMADDLQAINACISKEKLPKVKAKTQLMELDFDTFTFTVCGRLLSSLGQKPMRDPSVYRTLFQSDHKETGFDQEDAPTDGKVEVTIRKCVVEQQLARAESHYLVVEKIRVQWEAVNNPGKDDTSGWLVRSNNRLYNASDLGAHERWISGLLEDRRTYLESIFRESICLTEAQANLFVLIHSDQVGQDPSTKRGEQITLMDKVKESNRSLDFDFWLPEPDAVIDKTTMVCVQVTVQERVTDRIRDPSDVVFDVMLNRNLKTVNVFRVFRFYGEYRRSLIFTSEADLCLMDVPRQPNISVWKKNDWWKPDLFVTPQDLIFKRSAKMVDFTLGHDFSQWLVTRNVDLLERDTTDDGVAVQRSVDTARLLETPSLFKDEEVLDMVITTLCYTLYYKPKAGPMFDSAREAIDLFSLLFARRMALGPDLKRKVVKYAAALLPSSQELITKVCGLCKGNLSALENMRGRINFVKAAVVLLLQGPLDNLRDKDEAEKTGRTSQGSGSKHSITVKSLQENLKKFMDKPHDANLQNLVVNRFTEYLAVGLLDSIEVGEVGDPADVVRSLGLEKDKQKLTTEVSVIGSMNDVGAAEWAYFMATGQKMPQRFESNEKNGQEKLGSRGAQLRSCGGLRLPIFATTGRTFSGFPGSWRAVVRMLQNAKPFDVKTHEKKVEVVTATTSTPEQHVPDFLLRGSIPSSLIDAYDFYEEMPDVKQTRASSDRDWVSDVRAAWDDLMRVHNICYAYLQKFQVLKDKDDLVNLENAVVGMNVERGMHWIDGDNDGGVGSVGVITSISPDGSAQVMWPKGTASNYIIGMGGKYQLKVGADKMAHKAVDDDDDDDAGTGADEVELVKLFETVSRFLALVPDFAVLLFKFARLTEETNAWSSLDETWELYMKTVCRPAVDELTKVFRQVEDAEWMRLEPSASQGDDDLDRSEQWRPVAPANCGVGVRVRRGPDWMSQDVDGGPGGTGTIIGFTRPEKGKETKNNNELYCTVHWDTGAKQKHRLHPSNDLYMLPSDSLLVQSPTRLVRGRPMAVITLEVLAHYSVVWERLKSTDAEQLAKEMKDSRKLQVWHKTIIDGMLQMWRHQRNRLGEVLMKSLEDARKSVEEKPTTDTDNNVRRGGTLERAGSIAFGDREEDGGWASSLGRLFKGSRGKGIMRGYPRNSSRTDTILIHISDREAWSLQVQSACATICRMPNGMQGSSKSAMHLLSPDSLPEGCHLMSVLRQLTAAECLGYIEIWKRTDDDDQFQGLEINLPRLHAKFELLMDVYSQPQVKLVGASEPLYLIPERANMSSSVQALLRPFPHSLLLQSEAGVLFVLVPHVRVMRSVDSGWFSVNFVPVRGGPGKWQNTKTPYFLYEFHPSGAFLRAPSLTSGLYQILLLVLQRDYAGAFAQLDGVATDMALRDEEFRIFSSICAFANKQFSQPKAPPAGFNSSYWFSGFKKYKKLNTDYHVDFSPQCKLGDEPTWWDAKREHFLYDASKEQVVEGMDPGKVRFAVAKRERFTEVSEGVKGCYLAQGSFNVPATDSVYVGQWIEEGNMFISFVTAKTSGNPSFHPDGHAFWAKLILIFSSSPVYDKLGFDPWSQVALYVRHLSQVSAACRLTPEQELNLHRRLAPQTQEILKREVTKRTYKKGSRNAEVAAAGNVSYLAALMLMRFRSLQAKFDPSALPALHNVFNGEEEPEMLEPTWILRTHGRPAWTKATYGKIRTAALAELDGLTLATTAPLPNYDRKERFKLMKQCLSKLSTVANSFIMLYEMFTGTCRVYEEEERNGSFGSHSRSFQHTFATMIMSVLSDIDQDGFLQGILHILRQNREVAHKFPLIKSTEMYEDDRLKKFVADIVSHIKAFHYKDLASVTPEEPFFVEPPSPLVDNTARELVNAEFLREKLDAAITGEGKAAETFPINAVFWKQALDSSRSTEGSALQKFLVEQSQDSHSHLLIQPLFLAARNAGLKDKEVRGATVNSIVKKICDVAKGGLLPSQRQSLETMTLDEGKYRQLTEQSIKALGGLEDQLDRLNELERQLLLLMDERTMLEALDIIPQVANEFMATNTAADGQETNKLLGLLRASGYCATNSFVDIARRVLVPSPREGDSPLLLKALVLAVVLLAIRSAKAGEALKSLRAIRKAAKRDVHLKVLALEGQLNARRACLNETGTGAQKKLEILPLYLAFEFVGPMMLRDKQVVCVKQLVQRAEANESMIRQMIMGFGKSQVITPLVCLLLTRSKLMQKPGEERSVLVMVPPQLLDMSREVLRAVLTWVLSTPIFTFECTRSRDLTKDDQSKLEYVRKVHGVTLSHPKAVKALLLRFFEYTSLATGLHGIPKSQTPATKMFQKASDALVAKGCLQVFRTCVAIIDEVDMILDPLRSEVNFPVGNKEDLMPSPERWDLAEHILYAVFIVQADLQRDRANKSTLMQVRIKAMDAIRKDFKQTFGEAGDVALNELIKVMKEGLQKHALQLEPHLMLVSETYYLESIREPFAKWAALWLRREQQRHPLKKFLSPDDVALYLKKIPKSSDALYGRVLDTLKDTGNQIGLMNLAYSWISVLLPHVLSKPVRVSYGALVSQEWENMCAESPKNPPPQSRWKLAVPFVGKDIPSKSSEFAQPDVAIGFTILAFHHQGLRQDDVQLVLKKSQKNVENENGPIDDRPTMHEYRRWVEEGGGAVRTPAELMSLKQEDDLTNTPPLYQLQLDSAKQLEGLHNLLRYSPSMITAYLNGVFPATMNFQDQKLSASGEDIGGGILFNTVLGFSGTPNDLLPFGMCKRSEESNMMCDFEPGCEAEIVHVLASSTRTSLEILENDWNVERLLQGVAKGSATKGRYHALIDTGALITGMSNLDVAHYLLDHGLEDIGGVAFLNDLDQKLILLRDSKVVMKLSESRVPLDKQFTYYDQIHTTGTDVKHCPEALAAVTVGKDTTWRDHAQGCYRMRQIKDGQRLNLLLPPQVVSTIAGDLKVSEKALRGDGQRSEQNLEGALHIVTGWLLYKQVKTMAQRKLMLQFQDLANIWRRGAMDVLRDKAEALAAKCEEVSKQQTAGDTTVPTVADEEHRDAVKIFCEAVDFAKQDVIPELPSLSQVLRRELKRYQKSLEIPILKDVVDAKRDADFDSLLSKLAAQKLEDRRAPAIVLNAIRLNFSELDENAEENLDAEQEREQEQEQEAEKVPSKPPLEIAKFSERDYVRTDEDPKPWPLSILREACRTGDKSVPSKLKNFAYPVSDFGIFGAAPLQNLSKHPAASSLFVSSNFYRNEWTKTGHRRTKNFIMVVDVLPKLRQQVPDPLVPTVEPRGSDVLERARSEALHEVFTSIAHGNRKDHMRHEIARHVAGLFAGDVNLVKESWKKEGKSSMYDFKSFQQLMYNKHLLPVERGRFSVALTLREAESLRFTLHMRERSGRSLLELDQVELGLRMLFANGSLLESTADFKQGPTFQTTIHCGLLRFVDCHLHHEEQAIHQLLFPLSHEHPHRRQAFFRTCINSKRRLSSLLKGSPPVERLLKCESAESLLSSHATIFKVGVYLVHHFGEMAERDSEMGVKEYDQQLQDASQRVFARIDVDQSGSVEMEEIFTFMMHLGIFNKQQQREDHGRFMALFDMLDVNKDERLNREEFQRMMVRGLASAGDSATLDDDIFHHARLAMLKGVAEHEKKQQTTFTFEIANRKELAERLKTEKCQRELEETNRAEKEDAEVALKLTSIQTKGVKPEEVNPFFDVEHARVVFNFGTNELPVGCDAMGSLSKAPDGSRRVCRRFDVNSWVNLPGVSLPPVTDHAGHPFALGKTNAWVATLAFSVKDVPAVDEKMCLMSILSGTGRESDGARCGVFLKNDGTLFASDGSDEIDSSARTGQSYMPADNAANKVAAKKWHILTAIVDCAFGHSLHIWLDGEFHSVWTSEETLSANGSWALDPQDGFRLLAFNKDVAQTKTVMLGGRIRFFTVQARAFQPVEQRASDAGLSAMHNYVAENAEWKRSGVLTSMYHFVAAEHMPTGIWSVSAVSDARRIVVARANGMVEQPRSLFRSAQLARCPLSQEECPQEQEAKPLKSDKKQTVRAAQACSAIYPHQIIEFLNRNRQKIVIIFTVVPQSGLHSIKVELFRLAAQLGRSVQSLAFGVIVLDGIGHQTSQHVLSWEAPSLHIFPVETSKDSAQDRHSQRLDSAIEYQGSWTPLGLWNFLERCTAKCWLPGIVALTTEFLAYSNEHDLVGLCLALIDRALTELPQRVGLRNWAALHFGDQAMWTKPGKKVASETDTEKERDRGTDSREHKSEEDGTDDTEDKEEEVFTVGLRFRFATPETGPLADPRIRKDLSDYVKHLVEQDGDDFEIPCKDEPWFREHFAYLQETGVLELLVSVLRGLRCFHPPEPVEPFVAYLLRSGLRIGAEDTHALKGEGAKAAPTLLNEDVTPKEGPKEDAEPKTQAKPDRKVDRKAAAEADQTGDTKDADKIAETPHRSAGGGAQAAPPQGPSWASIVPWSAHGEKPKVSADVRTKWTEIYKCLLQVGSDRKTDKEILALAKEKEVAFNSIGGPLGGGFTLFHVACAVGALQVVQDCLLEQGIDPDLQANVESLCLSAVRFGSTDEGEDVLSACTLTGLEVAAAGNHADVCELFLERGALVGKALHVAVFNGVLNAAESILKKLEERGGKGLRKRAANAVMDGFSPLGLAVLGNHVEIAGLLLDNGADPLQNLTEMALRRLCHRPTYAMGSARSDQVASLKAGESCTVLQLAFRLGVGRRQLWERMLTGLENTNRLAKWPLNYEGTLCACAARPLILSAQGAAGAVRVDSKSFWLMKDFGRTISAVQLELTNKANRTEKKSDDDKQDVLGLRVVVEEEDVVESKEEDGQWQGIVESVSAEREDGSSLAMVLPWHLLADREGWDPIMISGFAKMDRELRGMLEQWSTDVEKSMVAELARLKADKHTKTEAITEHQNRMHKLNVSARKGQLGLFFWLLVFEDHNMEGTLQEFRLVPSDWEKRAAQAVIVQREKLQEALTESKKDVKSEEEKQEGRKATADLEEDLLREQMRKLKEKVAFTTLSLDVINSLSPEDRRQDLFDSMVRPLGDDSPYANSGRTSLSWRMHDSTEKAVTEVQEWPQSSGPPVFQESLVRQLARIELPYEMTDMALPSMNSLVVRAKLYAITQWASGLVAETAESAKRSGGDYNVLWQAFVLRLWSSDSRIASYATQQPSTSPGGLLRWFVHKATERAGEGISDKHNVLFAFLPNPAVTNNRRPPPSESSAGASSGRMQKRPVRLIPRSDNRPPPEAAAFAPPSLTRGEGLRGLKEGAVVFFQDVVPLSADPTVVWGMCREQEGEGGIVLKLHARNACPTWQFSICPEEQEHVIGVKDGAKLLVRRVTRGLSARHLFRGMDFATRTFHSSEMLDFPVGVPDGHAAIGTRLGLGNVTLIEAEEMELQDADRRNPGTRASQFTPRT